VILQKRKPEFENRTPEQWLAEIEKILCPLVRGAVAKLVWWDFFSVRKTTEKWNQLDGFLKFNINELILDDSKIAEGLEIVGYGDLAKKRVTVKKLVPTEQFSLKYKNNKK
jgi:hypothetical protein